MKGNLENGTISQKSELLPRQEIKFLRTPAVFSVGTNITKNEEKSTEKAGGRLQGKGERKEGFEVIGL